MVSGRLARACIAGGVKLLCFVAGSAALIVKVAAAEQMSYREHFLRRRNRIWEAVSTLVMSFSSFHAGRRRLLQLGSLVLLPSSALAQAPKRVEENDPQAQALGYKHDAAKVDKAKFKNFQAGQTCANCNFFKDKSGAAWGPCDILGGKEVNAKGWCTAWVKKSG